MIVAASSETEQNPAYRPSDILSLAAPSLILLVLFPIRMMAACTAAQCQQRLLALSMSPAAKLAPAPAAGTPTTRANDKASTSEQIGKQNHQPHHPAEADRFQCG